MYIQVIQGRCNDADRLKKQLDLWEQTIADGADGWLGSTSGVTDDGTSIAVVRFESRAQADANSARPEQDAWWRETSGCFDGEPSFTDYDDAFEWLGGGSDDAGFVQVMRGKVGNADGFRTFSRQPMDGLQEMRPEILGGTVAIADDGDFTQTDRLHLRVRCPRGREAGDARGRPARDGAGHGRHGRHHLPRPAQPLVLRSRLTAPLVEEGALAPDPKVVAPGPLTSTMSGYPAHQVRRILGHLRYSPAGSHVSAPRG